MGNWRVGTFQLEAKFSFVFLRKLPASSHDAFCLVASVSHWPLNLTSASVDGFLMTDTVLLSFSLTDMNVAISIISLFVFIAKLVLIIMRHWYPILSTFIHGSLAILYIVSMYGQMGPDHLDERYPSNIAWYIRMSCDVAKEYGSEKYCKMAKGTFAATVYMV